MPRVAQVPRVGASARPTSAAATASPLKSPLKIPLNDDVQEKGRRMHSRRALHEKKISQLKAAATPRKAAAVAAASLDDLANASPASHGGTPRAAADSSDEAPPVAGSSVTPMKRVPILANFEEWMKMATDNKINATNSWNFALIDYFHDMSLLREGDGVNFQKASCTLDGCVKIYTNRVDSVATETGKLLSGLADSDSRSNDAASAKPDARHDDSDEDEADGNGGVKKKTKKKRSSEATLAPSFASIQLKKFELEFAVDPLFKKASADFDEGGARGLLLNHLMIDSHGRIVFDSSDDAADIAVARKKRKRRREEDESTAELADPDDFSFSISQLQPDTSILTAAGDDYHQQDEAAIPIDLASLGQRYFPDLSRLDEFDVCPSLKNFDLGDPSGSSELPFLKTMDEWRADQEKAKTAGVPGDRSGMLIDDDAPAGFDDDDDGLGLGAFDMAADGEVAFGEGGEAWAREAALSPQLRVCNAAEAAAAAAAIGNNNNNDDDDVDATYIVSMPGSHHGDAAGEDLLAFFDQALQKNWANAEHWRIRKIKDVNRPPGETTRRRKEKEPFEIDFSSPLEPAAADALQTQAASAAAISLPKKDWKSRSRNLLADDRHFSSRSLLSLFLKPKARLARRRPRAGLAPDDDPSPAAADMDEVFWARHKGPDEPGLGPGAPSPSSPPAPAAADAVPASSYDANFFHDDGLPFPAVADDDDDDDELEYADAREHLSPDPGLTEAAGLTALLGPDAFPLTQTLGPGAFGTTLVTQTRRARPEYVQYARRAKKVDVRRLKEEIWKRMALDTAPKAPTTEKTPTTEPAPPPAPALRFTDVMRGLQAVYPKSVMADISTSYCFICLLHLANERGLAIDKTEALTELEIRKDSSADALDAAS